MTAKTQQGPRRCAVVVAAAIPFAGFVTFALVGSLGSYPDDLPGFWSYPSGTIGDALLLPVLIGSLYALAQSLPRRAGRAARRLDVGAAVVGMAGGAVVPVSWLTDDHAQLNWSMPSHGHFAPVGTGHAVFLILMCGLIVVLAVRALHRLHAAPDPADDAATPPGFRPTAVLLVLGGGLGMLVLIGRDSIVGGDTAASATTMIAILTPAVLFLGGLTWALGPSAVAAQWRAGLVVVGWLAGLAALIGHWPPRYPVLMGLAALTAVLAAVAATSSVRSVFDPLDGRWPLRWPTVLAVTVLLTGGLARSVDALGRGEWGPLIWLPVAAALAALLLHVASDGRIERKRLLGYGLFFGYCMSLYYLTARIKLADSQGVAAGSSVAVADTAFDVMVFALIQSRISEMGKKEEEDIGIEYVASLEEYEGKPEPDSEAPTTSTGAVVGGVVELGIAVVLALFTLLAIAAKPLGMDAKTANPSVVRVLLGAGVAVILPAGLVMNLRLSAWRQGNARPARDPADNVLHLPSWFWVAPALAAAAWTGTMLLLAGGPAHVPVLAGLVALVVFLLNVNTLVRSTTTLQTLAPTRGQKAVAVVAGAAAGAGAFWLVAYGIWEGAEPLPGWALLLMAVGVFAGNALVVLVAGHALAWGLPAGRATEHFLERENVKGYVAWDAAIFGLVFFVGVVIPLYAASRASELHATSLNVIAAMVFLPGLINAVVWGAQSWKIYDDKMQETHTGEKVILPRTIVKWAGGNDWEGAEQLDRDRLAELHTHLQLQRGGVAALMAVGLTYLTIVLVR